MLGVATRVRRNMAILAVTLQGRVLGEKLCYDADLLQRWFSWQSRIPWVLGH